MQPEKVSRKAVNFSGSFMESCKGSAKHPHAMLYYFALDNTFITKNRKLADWFDLQGCNVSNLRNGYEINLLGREAAIRQAIQKDRADQPKAEDHVCKAEYCEKCGQDHCKCTPCS